MKNFAGRVAVVTGAASGIGRAMADRFAREGMRIVLADIEQSALDQAQSEMRAAGSDVVGVRTDVSDSAQVKALADRAIEAFGAVHIICNNAGVASLGGPAWEQTRGRLALGYRREPLGRDPRHSNVRPSHALSRR